MSGTTSSDETLDFALSYAGEDVEVARAVAERLRELTFTVFLADEQRRKLVGVDGETFCLLYAPCSSPVHGPVISNALNTDKPPASRRS